MEDETRGLSKGKREGDHLPQFSSSSSSFGVNTLVSLLVRFVVGFLRLFSLDKRSLAFFRIAMALVTLYDIGQRFPDVHHHYADKGIISRSLALDKFHNYYWLSVHMLAGNDFYVQLIFLLHAIISVFMMVGYRSRLFTFLNWVMVCSLQNRNYIVCHSGDTVHRVMLFWAIFLPLGEVFSLDSILWKQKTKKDRGPAKYEVLGLAAAAFTIQIYIMYVTAHFHKSAPEWRSLGTATWMALQLDFFRTWVGDIFSLFPGFCKFLTFAVLYWQVFGVALYFAPVGKFSKYLKTFSVFGFTCMHLGFGMCLALEQFTWVTVASLMGVIPGWAWEAGVKYFESKKKKTISICYLNRSQFSNNLADVLGLFMLPKTKVIPVDNLPGHTNSSFFGIAVIDPLKASVNGADVLEVICRESPILYPLYYVYRNKYVKSFMYSLSQTLYNHRIISDVDIEDTKPYYNPETANNNIINISVEDHHHSNGASTSMSDDEQSMGAYSTQPPHSHPHKTFHIRDESLNMYAIRKTVPIVLKVVVELLMGFLLFLVLTWNSGNIGYHTYATPSDLRPVLWVTQLDQYWGMFAPRPPDVMWWYNIEAELDDGTSAEIFNNGALFTMQPNIPHTFDKPKDMHEAMKNHRWFKLFENGLNSHEAREELRLNFGRWLCREYNDRHFGSQRLYKYSIHWMNERVDLQKQDGTRYAGNKQTLWNHLCYDKK